MSFKFLKGEVGCNMIILPSNFNSETICFATSTAETWSSAKYWGLSNGTLAPYSKAIFLILIFSLCSMIQLL